MSFEAPKLPEGFYFKVTTFSDNDGENVLIKLVERKSKKFLFIELYSNTTIAYKCRVVREHIDTDHLHEVIKKDMDSLASRAHHIHHRRINGPSTRGIVGEYPPKKIVGGKE